MALPWLDLLLGVGLVVTDAGQKLDRALAPFPWGLLSRGKNSSAPAPLASGAAHSIPPASSGAGETNQLNHGVALLLKVRKWVL